MGLDSKITNLKGVGLLIRTILNLYLIYLAIILNVKIPGWYFLLFGLSSLSYTMRIFNLNSYIIKNYANLHGYKSVYQMPNFMESSLGAIINIIAGMYLIMLQK